MFLSVQGASVQAMAPAGEAPAGESCRNWRRSLQVSPGQSSLSVGRRV